MASGICYECMPVLAATMGNIEIRTLRIQKPSMSSWCIRKNISGAMTLEKTKILLTPKGSRHVACTTGQTNLNPRNCDSNRRFYSALFYSQKLVHELHLLSFVVRVEILADCISHKLLVIHSASWYLRNREYVRERNVMLAFGWFACSARTILSVAPASSAVDAGWIQSLSQHRRDTHLASTSVMFDFKQPVRRRLPPVQVTLHIDDTLKLNFHMYYVPHPVPPLHH